MQWNVQINEATWQYRQSNQMLQQFHCMSTETTTFRNGSLVVCGGGGGGRVNRMRVTYFNRIPWVPLENVLRF